MLQLLDLNASSHVAVLGASFFAAIFAVLYRAGSLSKQHHDSKTPSIWSLLLSPTEKVKSRFNAWRFLFQGPSMIQAAYDKSNGAPFSMDMPENTMLIVSDWKRIKEIDSAPEAVLSLQGAAKEILQPMYTMKSFDWTEKRGGDGAPLLKTLRNRLTEHLPNILHKIHAGIKARFDEGYDTFPLLNGVKQGAVFPLIIEAVAKSNAEAFFGPELSGDEQFMEAGMSMIEQTLLIAEIMRLVPRPFKERAGKFLSSHLNSGLKFCEKLEPIVAQRFHERDLRRKGHDIPEQKDCVQWIMQYSPQEKPWSVRRVVHELIAVWFGSVHITSTTACVALFDLCEHPEYVDILRQEVEQTGWEAFYKSGGTLFPLMDSFMKESARLHPIESVSTRRKALKSFQFSDGQTVEAGQWVCTAPRGMNTDSANFVHPNDFYGFRFVQPEVLAQAESLLALSSPVTEGKFNIPEPGKSSKYIELSDWQQWGTGRCACTGRWYASALIKTMLGTFITNYDMKLVDPKAQRTFAWRTFVYPYAGTQIQFTPRVENRSC
ncbi:hypothetical protein KVR01_008054 [Diaporthe batatas]|uniref:uncharacterized protein n=1 Tax=Diaporthe batatas TaxID=748121 RepID=UPI001D046321|nr:uncharacterized protein KVR01_008054 [Diaporthe batatas]KAG8162289.1 hypothetical protein KVR01_008054 [Diaporthe batatas]